MLALAILAIGAAGVISMQRGAIQGNVDARRLDMANSIAREWTERLRRDAMMWTLPNQANATSNIGQAKLLANIDDGKWHLPNQRVGELAADGVTPLNSPAFDILGVDQGVINNTNTNVMFCAHVRLTTLVANTLLRAEVRVFYPRGLDVTPPAGFCSADPTTGTPDTSLYHYVYAITAIRKNTAP